MKHHLVAILRVLLSVLVLFGPMRQAAGQGTAFTYPAGSLALSPGGRTLAVCTLDG